MRTKQYIESKILIEQQRLGRATFAQTTDVGLGKNLECMPNLKTDEMFRGLKHPRVTQRDVT